MPLLDFLFGSDTPPNVTTTTSSSSTLPEWYQEYLKNIIGKAADVTNEPYQQYTGARVADQTPDTLAAYDMTRQGIGSAQPYQQGAETLLGQVGSGFDADEFAKYQSPYTEGVVNRIAELGERNLSENLLPNVNQTFTGAGQFGSTRHEDFTNRALRDANESILGQQAGALESAQQRAMEGYQAGQQQKLSSAAGLGQLGSQVQQSGLTDAASLEAIGGAQQTQDQRGLDLAYQDFLAERDYPKQQVQFVSDIARGQNPGMNTTGTTTGPGQQGASPVSQLGGLALGTAAAGKAFGLFKKGGVVRGIGRYAEGGSVANGAEMTQMEMNQAAISHLQAAGEYAASIPMDERTPYEDRAIKDYIEFFGMQPQELPPESRAVPQRAGRPYRMGGVAKGIGHYAMGGQTRPMRPGMPQREGLGTSPHHMPVRPPMNRGISNYGRAA